MLSGVDCALSSWRKNLSHEARTPRTWTSVWDDGLSSHARVLTTTEKGLLGGGCCGSKHSNVIVNPQQVEVGQASSGYIDPKFEYFWTEFRDFLAKGSYHQEMRNIKHYVKRAPSFESHDIMLFALNACDELRFALRQNTLPRCAFEVPKLLIPMLCVLFDQDSPDFQEVLDNLKKLKKEGILPHLLGSQELSYYFELIRELCKLLQRQPATKLLALSQFGMFHFNKAFWSHKAISFLDDKDWEQLKAGGCSDKLVTFLQIGQAIVKCKRNKKSPEEQTRVIWKCFKDHRTAQLPFLLSLYYFGPRINSEKLFKEVAAYIMKACGDYKTRGPALLLLLYLAGRENRLVIPGFQQRVLEFLANKQPKFLRGAFVGVEGFLFEPEWFIERIPLYFVPKPERETLWINLCGIDPGNRFRYLQFLEKQVKFGYIDLDVAYGMSPELKAFPIDEQISEFLAHPTQKVAVLLGDPGSGKSLFSIKLCEDLLKRGNDWLPFYIYLPENQQKRGEILNAAIKQRFLNPHAVVMKHRPILFILDAYDEVTLGQINFIAESSTFKHFPHSKILFTCRTNEVRPFSVFLPEKEPGVPQVSFIKLYIKPFTESKLEQFVKKKRKDDAQQVLDKINRLPGLKQLLHSPYLLDLCVSNQEIFDRLKTVSGPILRVHIYQKFTEIFQESLLRKKLVDVGSEDAADKRKHYKENSYRIAFLALRYGVIDLRSPEVKAIGISAVFGSPLVPIPRDDGRAENRFKFVHPSHMDFLAAEALVAELKQSERGCLNAESSFNQNNIVPRDNVRQFIEEMVHDDQSEFEDILRDIVLQTRTREDITQASANAMTLLNQLGNCFAKNKDFSNVKISGANLSGATLKGVSLENSELCNVNMDGCSLTSTNLRKAKMTNVRFGRRAPLCGHSNWIRAVSFSPDGILLASGSWDNTVIVWEAATGHQLHTLRGHSSQVNAVSFSPDGTLIASGSDDETVILWDTATAEQVRTLHGHGATVTAVSFSPDGSLIASASDDSSVILWKVTTGKKVGTLLSDSSHVNAVCFSPDGALVAAGSDNSRINIWSTATGDEVHVLEGHSSDVTAICFSPDGALLVSASDDIILWETATGESVRTLDGHTSDINTVCFSPDGAFIASGCDTIIVWEAATGQQIRTLDGHSSEVYSLCFSPDGTLIVSAGDDKTIIVWETATSQHIHSLPKRSAQVYAVGFSPDRTLVASGDLDNLVMVWNATTGRQLRVLKGHSDRVQDVRFSPDGEFIVSGSWDSTLIVWSTNTGDQLRILEGHSRRVRTVCFSPDSAIIASGSEDCSVILWEVATGNQLRTLQGHSRQVRAVCFAPDGALIVSGSNDYTVIVWDTATGQQIHVLKRHRAEVYAVCFSPDGNFIVSGCDDNLAVVWEVATGNQIHVQSGDSCSVLGICFSSTGALVVSEGGNNTLVIWEAATGNHIHTLQGHSADVNVVCFSSDCLYLASGSDDATVIVWDISTRNQVQIGEPSDAYVECVSSDGAFICATSDETISIKEAATGHEIYTLEGVSTSAIVEIGFLSQSTIRAYTKTGEFTWTISPTVAVYSEDLKTIMFKTESGYDCWDVETGKQVAYSPEILEIGPPVVYKQVPNVKVHMRLGSAGLACYGVMLEGAIISKSNMDLLNSLITKAS